MMRYGLRCRTEEGVFSGERICIFLAYNHSGQLVEDSHPAPKDYVRDEYVRVQERRTDGDKTFVRIAQAGSGDFVRFLVPTFIVIKLN